MSSWLEAGRAESSRRTPPVGDGGLDRSSFSLVERAPALERLGRYDVIAHLGEGGMAKVYLAASKTELGDASKLVVLKVLRHPERHVEMFLREASIAVRLRHPNVVSTLNAQQDGDDYFIVMEYLEGVSLATLIAHARRWNAGRRLLLLAAIMDALSGLHYVHEFRDFEGRHLGLVHRDFKPSNIFVTLDGQVKLLDFGIAKATAQNTDVTLGQAVKGTTRYMAPEFLSKGDPVDRRSDVYSAGVTIAEAVLGAHPSAEVSDIDILQSLMNKEPVGVLAASDPPGGMPAGLFDVIRRATAMNMDDRPATAEELRASLAHAMHGLGLADAHVRLRELVREQFGALASVRNEQVAHRLRRLADTSESAASTDRWGGATTGGRRGFDRVRRAMGQLASWRVAAPLAGVLGFVVTSHWVSAQPPGHGEATLAERSVTPGGGRRVDRHPTEVAAPEAIAVAPDRSNSEPADRHGRADREGRQGGADHSASERDLEAAPGVSAGDPPRRKVGGKSRRRPRKRASGTFLEPRGSSSDAADVFLPMKP